LDKEYFHFEERVFGEDKGIGLRFREEIKRFVAKVKEHLKQEDFLFMRGVYGWRPTG